MTVTVRKSNERGHADHGWLDSYHSFSFADYYDPAHMGFRALRVINDDIIKGGAGFPPHGHRDMEIVSYVVRGALAHKDSTGGQGILRRGDVQAMTAGSGVRHSEFNGDAREDARLLQIWILPAKEGLAPGYSQKNFPDAEKRDVLRLLASGDGEEGALRIHQDARIYASLLGAGKKLAYTLGKGRGAWLQVVEGALSVNGVALGSGDAAAIEDAGDIVIEAARDSEFLLFDLA